MINLERLFEMNNRAVHNSSQIYINVNVWDVSDIEAE